MNEMSLICTNFIAEKAVYAQFHSLFACYYWYAFIYYICMLVKKIAMKLNKILWLRQWTVISSILSASPSFDSILSVGWKYFCIWYSCCQIAVWCSPILYPESPVIPAGFLRWLWHCQLRFHLGLVPSKLERSMNSRTR